MSREFQSYIDRVINSIGVSGRKEKQIREDIYASLMEKQQATGECDPYILMGNPEEVAMEFRDNMDIKPNRTYYSGYAFEYVSKTKIFGIPLVHINGKPMGVAKGILAIGGMSIGVVSLGGISIGVLSLGGMSLGILISLGGISLSGLLSLGGVAVSYAASIGGVAIAHYLAVGGFAKASIAIGGVARGIVAVFQQHGTGEYMFKTPVNANEVVAAIKAVFPKMGNGLLNFIKIFLQ